MELGDDRQNISLLVEFSGTENAPLFSTSCSGCVSTATKFNPTTGGATMIDATASAKTFVYLME